MARLGSNSAVPTQTSVVVNTANTVVLAGNTNRSKLILSNNGTNPVYFTLDGSNATVTNGIVLAAGATFIDDLRVTPKAINAIATTASSTLAVVEFVD